MTQSALLNKKQLKKQRIRLYPLLKLLIYYSALVSSALGASAAGASSDLGASAAGASGLGATTL